MVAASAPTINRRYATEYKWAAPFRGLKPTATISSSLCEARETELTTFVLFVSAPHPSDQPTMIFSRILIFLAFAARFALASEAKVEIGGAADWQKPILEKVEFAACLRSLPEILKDEGKRSDGPSFLIFTTEAREDL